MTLTECRDSEVRAGPHSPGFQRPVEDTDNFVYGLFFTEVVNMESQKEKCLSLSREVKVLLKELTPQLIF